MPNIKSAKKRVKVSEAKALNNKMVKSNLKTVCKKANSSIQNNESNKNDALKSAIKKTDTAVSKGVIHKNKAARIKSSLQTKFNSSK